MRVETYLFGEVDVAEEKVITFPDGLLSFEDCKRFTLIHELDKGNGSYTLQSLDDPNLAFQIADPTAMGFHYELVLTDEESAKLGNPDLDDVAVMLVLFKNDPRAGGHPINANVRAPLLIYPQGRVAIQKVMESVTPNITLTNLSSLASDV